MAKDLRFMIYDTWQPSTVANAQQVLFQSPSGADATHTPIFTNMRGAGSFPQTEKMVVDKISIFLDKTIAVADIAKWLFGGNFEFVLANISVLQLPLQALVAHDAWSGALVEGTPADAPTIGLLGMGWTLDKVLEIEGATPFKAILTQGLALSAQTNVKVALEGIYTIAGLN